MKKLLFHYPVLNMGGAEMSSLRMMKALADRGWDITLVLTTGGGELESAVDPRVQIVRLRPCALGYQFSRARGIVARVVAIPDLMGYVVIRIIGMLRMLPFLFRNYHAAAVLLQGTDPFFVTRIVKASTKMHWIRNDLRKVDPEGHITFRLKKSLHLINHFVCVSNTARDSLIREIPEAKSRSSVIYNILDVEAMMAKLQNAADPFLPRRSGEVRLLSVCRLSDQSKAIFRMAHVCSALLACGYNFRWYVIGDGSDKEKLLTLISDLGIENTMILLGKLHNPFPAYLHTDLVAVLSYYEGLCGVINEAKVAGKAVIATEVSGVSEQLTHGKNGWTVSNDQQSIIEGIANLISSPELLASITNNHYPLEITDDSKKIDKLEELFNGNFCETHAK